MSCPPPMASGCVVLVHGGWAGGWCWADVARELESRGHAVAAPTLIGFGCRFEAGHRRVDLSTHVNEVVAMITTAAVGDIVLVGHSYGGMVITGVAASAPGAVTRLIYLDAFVPSSGQSAYDLMPEYVERDSRVVREFGDGWLLPPDDPRDLGVHDERLVSWLNTSMRPMPVETLRQPLTFDVPPWTRVASAYVLTSDARPFTRSAETIGDAGCPVLRLRAGHMPMVTAPAATAALISRIASE